MQFYDAGEHGPGRQPIDELAAICRERRICFCGRCSSFGKLAVRPEVLFTISRRHEFHGPARERCIFAQACDFANRPRRVARTAAGPAGKIAAIVGMSAAAGLAERAFRRAATPGGRCASALAGHQARFPGVIRNGHTEHAGKHPERDLPELDGEALLIGLDLEGVCASADRTMVGSFLHTCSLRWVSNRRSLLRRALLLGT
jgi:cysteine desulfurase